MKRFFAVCLLTPMLAIAANDAPLDLEKVTTQQRQIRSDILSGKGNYRGIPQAKQSELLERQDGLLRMLEGKQTADQLTEDERIAAFNDLEWIEATLNKAEEGDRLVCRRERTIGSNRVTRVCRTAAQLEFERERAREDLDRNDVQMVR